MIILTNKCMGEYQKKKMFKFNKFMYNNKKFKI